MEYKTLFSPMKIGNVEIKNRIVMSPMEMGFGQMDGTPTDMLIEYYEERAKGGVGLMIPGITRVNDFSGASTFCQLSVSRDSNIKPLKEFIDRIHQYGTKVFIQLHHPGRQNVDLLVGTVKLSVFCNKFIPKYPSLLKKVVPLGVKMMEKDLVLSDVAPSKCERSYIANAKVRGLTKCGVKRLIKQFIDGAERCKKAGADGVELHGAHGYLIQQFLSPNTNHRQDEYGGSLENRMRFLLEIIRGIRERCGKDFPIIVRISVDECYDKIGKEGKGYGLDEGVEMCKILDKEGVDAIDVSSACYDTINYWLEPVTFDLGWRKYMAEAVKKVVSVPVLAANIIRTPEQAEQQLQEGVQDFISLGRPLLADPYWAKKAEEGRSEDIKRCICCLNCFETMEKNAYVLGHGECAINPVLGREKANNELPSDGNGRLVTVIGAGPSGLTAAETLLRRGFKVVVIEKASDVGGQLRLAEKPPKKDKIAWCYEDLKTSVIKLGGEIRLNTTATIEMIDDMKPYAVIVATGGVPVVPRSIEGTDGKNVVTVTPVLDGTVKFEGKRIAVIGSGMTGLETAHLLAEQGNAVTIVEMASTVAPGVWCQHVDDIMPKLKAKNVEIYVGHKLNRITDEYIEIEEVNTAKLFRIDVDEVVLSIGVRPVNDLYDKLKETHNNVYAVGDATSIGRIAHATKTAYDTAIKLV